MYFLTHRYLFIKEKKIEYKYKVFRRLKNKNEMLVNEN